MMRNKKSILFILPIIPHYRQELLRSVFKLNKEVVLASDFSKNEKIKNLSLDDLNKINKEIKFHKLKNIYINNKVIFQLGFYKTILKSKSQNILAVGNVYNISLWLLLFIKKIFKIRVVLWTHGNLCDKRNLKYHIKNLMFSLSDKVIFYEKRSENFFRSDYPNSSTDVCYNSFKYHEFKNYRNNFLERSKKIKYNRNYFCFVGRLTKVKKLNQILQAFKYLQNENKIDIGFVFVGDGEEKNNLKKTVSDYNLKNIEFLDSIYDTIDLVKICSKSLGMVSPGNIGLSAITAISCGIPVITHNNLCKQMPEVGALTNNKNGYFFIENDITDLSKVMLSVIKNNNGFKELSYKTLDLFYNPTYQSQILLKT